MTVRRLVAAGALLLASLGLSDCRRAGDEAQIRQRVAELAAAAEAGDGGRLAAGLASGYRDGEGRDREQTRALLLEYHERWRGIVVHVLEVRFVALRPPVALIETDVAVSSGAAEALRRIIRFSGECYRFRCRLQRDAGGWRVAVAEWRPIDTAELPDTAVRTLRRLFPLL